MASTLERRFKFGINAESDAGVPINIIDPREFRRTCALWCDLGGVRGRDMSSAWFMADGAPHN